MPKYNPDIGQLTVEFTDYYDQLQKACQGAMEGIAEQAPCDTPQDALKDFVVERALSENQAYELAQYLAKQGWEVYPQTFARSVVNRVQDVVDHSTNVFDQYFDALRQERYELAHQIYESMTPNQQQVIKDRSRRGAMADKRQKLAQRAEDVPLVQRNPVADYDELEVIARGQELIDKYHGMGLPPESMKIFMPFGAALDELRRAREQFDLGRVDRATMNKRFEDYLDKYGRVLYYLKGQGYNVDRELDAVKQHASTLFQGAPGASTRASAARKMLALASKLHAKGHSDLARQMLRVIQAQEAVNVAEDIIHGPLAQFKQLLMNEDFDGARKLYLELDPVDRRKADDLAKQHFAAAAFIQLRAVGESLFAKGKYAEATKINRMIRAQFMELPPEMQNQVILLIIPEGEELPQAFQSTEDAEENTKKMEERVTDMRDRLNPCNPHCGKAIPKLLQLADRLDAEGKTALANQIDQWIEKVAKESKKDKDKLPGGLADKKTDDQGYDSKELNTGRDVEMEHTNDRQVAEEIAKDHLTEHPKGYYRGLKNLERKLDKKKAAVEADVPPKKSDIKPGKAFEGDIEKESVDNANFRKVLFTGKNLQLVVMSLKPGEDIGVETHASVDQFFRIEDGEAKFVVQGREDYDAKDGDSVLVPTGTQHNIINTSSDKELKLYTLYSPPNHPVNTVHATKEDAIRAGEMAKEAGFLKKTKKEAKEHGKPEKVVEIADAIRRDNPGTSDEAAYRMAWETYCSYTNRNHPGCTEKGKSMRKSPKPYEKAASSPNEAQDLTEEAMQIREEQKKKKKQASHKCMNCGGPIADFEHSDVCEMCHKEGDDGLEKEAKDKYVSPEGHFKGREGSGERWDNCIKYQMSKGKSKESAEKICGYIKSRKGSSSVATKEADSARKKYVSEEGHFKGREGSGERWDNCIKYQMSQGKSKEAAEKICGYIKSRKGSSSVYRK